MDSRHTWTVVDWDSSSVDQEKAMLCLEKKSGSPTALCTSDYFNWQYRRNPAGHAIIKLAMRSGEEAGGVIGQYVALPWVIAARGYKITVALSVNTLVSSEFRGRGVILPLAHKCFQACHQAGISHIIGYPNQNIHAVATRFLNFTDIAEVPLLIRMLRLSSTVRKKFPIKALRGPAAWLASMGDFVFRTKEPRAGSVCKVEKFDQAYDELNACLIRRFPFMVSRHSAFLNWRYIESPLGYSVLAVRDGGIVAGFLVYRIMDFAGMRCGMIVDFVLRGDASSPNAGRRLLQTALYELQTCGCDVAGALCQTNIVESRLLNRHLFISCPTRLKPHPLRFACAPAVSPSTLDAEFLHGRNWFVSMGDYDAA
jgi:GNAT superfamily N-acetyltransferase